MLTSFFSLNSAISQYIDQLAPGRAKVDGNHYFKNHILANAFEAEMIVWEVGGGSQPYLSSSKKEILNIKVMGLDISQEELDAAPPGAYDHKYVTDLCTYTGAADADIVICQSTLEHVPNTNSAIRAMSSIIKPGGKVYIFVPCRNALYARLNLLLPEKIKNYLLKEVSPNLLEHQGFPAFYNDCVPSKIEKCAQTHNLKVVERHHFWASSYFKNFVPAYIIWRAWQLILYLFLKNNAAETFIFVLQKNTNRS